MRVFLSWSGSRSRLIAQALRDWLPGVMQVVQPWMSAIDMQMGARWNADLAKELEQAKIGIICITPENQTTAWLVFEAGALSKIVDAGCVIPYLLNMRPTEVEGPLVQFQAAVANRDDTFRVVSTINRALGTVALSEEGLVRSFQKWWPDLERSLMEIPTTAASDPPPRPERELLEEILGLARENTREQIERAAVAEYTASRRQRDMMTLTHQLQAPLVAVANALSFAKDRGVTNDALPLIEHSEALVEDLIAMGYGITSALASEEGRSIALMANTVDVADEAFSIARRVQRTSARNDLRIMYRKSPDFPQLVLDRQALASVIYSLMHNAVKYADSDSEIALELLLSGPDHRPILSVRSVGEPIPPTERERIFEKFARGRQVERGRLYAGVGLGLWVARQLTRAMGGELILEQNSEDPRVATFVVHFNSEAGLR
ncbi:MAG: ATP-binding protein [Acidobacteriota bacterium]